MVVPANQTEESESAQLVPEPLSQEVFLVDVSNIFYFFLLGEGKGESRATGRGEVSFFY